MELITIQTFRFDGRWTNRSGNGARGTKTVWGRFRRTDELDRAGLAEIAKDACHHTNLKYRL